MLGKQLISEALLIRTWNAGAEPIRVRNCVRPDDMDRRWIENLETREHMRNRIQNVKGLVDRNL